MALDLSTHVGWAYGHDFERPLHGVWLLGKMVNLGRCCSCLAGELEAAIALFQPSLLILEAPLPPQAQTAAATARLQFGLAAVAEMVAFEHDLACEEERADVVRKMVLGGARKDKKVIIEWCRQQGWSPAEDNDADALVLLRYRHILGRMRVTGGAGSAAKS